MKKKQKRKEKKAKADEEISVVEDPIEKPKAEIEEPNVFGNLLDE
mgnify:CR=1 FL=1